MASLQEKWTTSGASRLKARQNRGFSYRAKQRASTGLLGPSTIMNKKRGEGKSQTAKRRRIIVGQTASSETAIDPYVNLSCQQVASSAPVSSDDGKFRGHLHELEELSRESRRIQEIQPGSYLNDATTLTGSSSGLSCSFRDPFTEAIVLGSLRDRSHVAPSPRETVSLSSALQARINGILPAYSSAHSSAETLQRWLSSPPGRGGGSAAMNIGMYQQIDDKDVLNQWLSASSVPSASLTGFSNSADLLSASSLSSQGSVLQEILAEAKVQQQEQIRRQVAFHTLRGTMQQRINSASASGFQGGSKQSHGISIFFNKSNDPMSQTRSPASSTLSTETSSVSSFPVHPIRFFNNGCEIHVDGHPKAAIDPKTLKPKVPQKKHRRTESDKVREEKKRLEDLKQLQARQQSVWEAFGFEDEEEIQEGEKGKEIGDEEGHDDQRKQSADMLHSNEEGKQVDGKAEEQKKTLHAANVLMALSPRDINTKKEV